jgi:hypothetical protein
MANRRMIAKTIVESDAFLDMPQSSQLLYFYLNFNADDDGFVNNPKSVMRNTGCKDDDLSMLIIKKFIIPFQSGIVVIKHWRIHNYIQSDRYHETKYTKEKSMLMLNENNSYSLPGQEITVMDTECIQNVSIVDTQVRLGKVSLGEVRQGEPKKTKSIHDKLVQTYGEKVVEGYYESIADYELLKGRSIYKDYSAAARQWIKKDIAQGKGPKPLPPPPQDCPACGSRVITSGCNTCTLEKNQWGKVDYEEFREIARIRGHQC